MAKLVWYVAASAVALVTAEAAWLSTHLRPRTLAAAVPPNSGGEEGVASAVPSEALPAHRGDLPRGLPARLEPPPPPSLEMPVAQREQTPASANSLARPAPSDPSDSLPSPPPEPSDNSPAARQAGGIAPPDPTGDSRVFDVGPQPGDVSQTAASDRRRADSGASAPLCGGGQCKPDQFCCGPPECGICTNKAAGPHCPKTCP
jgi:hypothetical protein